MAKFDKKAGKFINRERAEKSKAKWKACGIRTESSFFGLDAVLELLSTKGAIGLRIHYGMDEEGNMQPVLTAELEASATKSSGEVMLLNASYPCPPFCQDPTDPEGP